MENRELIPDLVRGFKRWVSTRRHHDDPICEMGHHWVDFQNLAEAHESFMNWNADDRKHQICERWNVWRPLKDRLGLEELMELTWDLTTLDDDNEEELKEFWTAVMKAYHASNAGSAVRGYGPRADR